MEELSNHDAISNTFSNSFRDLMGKSTPSFDIGGVVLPK